MARRLVVAVETVIVVQSPALGASTDIVNTQSDTVQTGDVYLPWSSCARSLITSTI